MRTIGEGAVESFDSNNSTGKRNLRRVLRLYQRADGSELQRDGWIIDGPTELVALLEHAKKSFGECGQSRLIPLLDFLAREATPKELLLALSRWSPSTSKLNLFEVLRTALRRGAKDSRSAIELSKSLRYVREVRIGLQNSEANDSRLESYENESFARSGMWKRMSQGTLPMAK